MTVYVASSGRAIRHHRAVVLALRQAGHTVYDWTDSVGRFDWGAVGLADGRPAHAAELRRGLAHPTAQAGFRSDAAAVAAADALVLVQPAGRSAHLEAGFAAGTGKPIIVYVPIDEPQPPDLMLGWAREIVGDLRAVLEALDRVATG